MGKAKWNVEKGNKKSIRTNKSCPAKNSSDEINLVLLQKTP
jgi:hypothetical protein